MMGSDFVDLLIALFLAFCTDTLIDKVWHVRKKEGKPDDEDEETYLRSHFAAGLKYSVSFSAKVFLALWFTEEIMKYFPYLRQFGILGFTPMDDQWINLREAAPGVAFTLFMGLTAATVKHIVLLKSVTGRKLGRVALIDHLLNFVVFLLTTLSILDLLNVDLTMGIQSILSAGGVGALILSFAAKDLAENMVGGFSLQAWEAFQVGDTIRLNDGTEGIVVEIGLVETLIRKWDNIVTRIPNSHLTSARISNLSRVEQSRLTQDLRFEYRDLEKLPDVLLEITQEVERACPKVLKQGKAPRAKLTEYKPDHIEATVVAHFSIKYATGEFHNNRQEFLLAIARAMKKHNVSFALPSMVHRSPPTEDAKA